MTTERCPMVDLYRDDEDRWRWRRISNGHILADSGQSYTNKADAVHGLELTTGRILLTYLGGTPVLVLATDGLGRPRGSAIPVRVIS